MKFRYIIKIINILNKLSNGDWAQSPIPNKNTFY